jgi:ABC-2 type transport system ATP-binding protein
VPITESNPGADDLTAHVAATTAHAPATVLSPVSSPGPDADSGLAIRVRGLRRSYGDRQAVRGIDFDVARGEILAFLGPNGAGKTTTVEMLEGFRKRSAGEVSVLGTDPEHAGPDWRARVGVVLQSSKPERLLSVRECLGLYAGYYPAPLDVDHALDLVGLADKAAERCEKLSGGQQRRLDVALALVGDPELVFLDEPTTGFDPSARHTAWNMIRDLRGLGKTIFLTTHFMDEAECLADRILILAAGRIVASGTPEAIGDRTSAATIIRFTLPENVTAKGVPPVAGTVTASGGRRVEISTPEPMPALGVLSSWAARHGYPLSDISVHRSSLEEIYLRLTEEIS